MLAWTEQVNCRGLSEQPNDKAFINNANLKLLYNFNNFRSEDTFTSVSLSLSLSLCLDFLRLSLPI